MSDLGAIFHVRKNGVQYDAHAYTTTAECPEPNLKIRFKGQQAYIKLEAKGSGDVPCYVKKRDGSVFQVRATAVVPTGQVRLNENTPITFIIPSLVKVLEVVATGYSDGSGNQIRPFYVGVTPGTQHIFEQVRRSSHDDRTIRCNTHSKILGGFSKYNSYIYIKWSPEINKQTPTVTDY